MSDTTKEINWVTGLIIKVSLRLIIFALLILFLFEGAKVCYEFGHDIFYAKAMSGEPGTAHTVVIREGADAGQVGRLLADSGLIKNEYAFLIQAKIYDSEIYPGTYQLSTAMTSKEILEELGTVREAEADQEEAEAGE